MNESMTVEEVSVLPRIELGKWKSSVVYVNTKSLLGIYDWAITNRV